MQKITNVKSAFQSSKAFDNEGYTEKLFVTQ